jgi:hypothetical protein
VVLTQNVVKSLGTVFSGEDLVAHAGEHRDLTGFVMIGFLESEISVFLANG